MAMAAPRPLAEPVTRATLLSSRKLSRMFADVFCMLRPMYVVGWSRGNSVDGMSRALQSAVHHQSFHVPETGMQEGIGKAANRRKAELLPEMNRRKIAADDKVELHGAEAMRSRVLQRMGAHRSGHTATGCPGGRHVAAVADVGAPA